MGIYSLSEDKMACLLSIPNGDIQCFLFIFFTPRASNKFKIVCTYFLHFIKISTPGLVPWNHQTMSQAVFYFNKNLPVTKICNMPYKVRGFQLFFYMKILTFNNLVSCKIPAEC